MSTRPPVIIIGMHRSGTTMVTQLLEALGLFVGKEKEANHEALFFHKINEWLLSQSWGHWDHPEAIHELIANQEIRGLVMDYVGRYLMKSPRTIEFLGWKKYVRYRTPLNLDIPWGWKSPLNTYTLPLWQDLFPDAKVIHIYRHGVDVASSLRTRGRQDMRRTRLQDLYYHLTFLHWLRTKPGTFIDSVRCDSLEGGFSLWEEYLSEARRHVERLQDRALELRYEDFLSEPLPILKELALFCGLSTNAELLAKAVELVKSDRAYAFCKKAELRLFASRVSERLSALNYIDACSDVIGEQAPSEGPLRDVLHYADEVSQ